MELLNYAGSIFHYAISFVVILSIVVFIHEFGHFIVARACGVKVDEFSIGFGKELFGWNDRKGTRWKVCALPLGGFVKMHGDEGAASNPDFEKLDSMTAAEKKISFNFKPLWQKAAIVSAGPVFNFILSIFIFFSIFTFYGKLQFDAPAVAEKVMEGGAADAIGMKPGDKILTLDGKAIKGFSELQEIIRMAPYEKLPITYQRGDEVIESVISPKYEEIEVNGEKVRMGMIGIERAGLEVKDEDFVRLGVGAALVEATNEVYKQCKTMLKGLWQIITGIRSSKELGGPVKIMEYSGQSTSNISDGLACFINGEVKDKEGKVRTDCGKVLRDGFLIAVVFMAMISTMLGLVNLFPIPMLDGGHLLFYLIEAVARRPLAEKAQEWLFRGGFAFLIGLMLYATYNDIVSFVQRHVVS